MKKKWKFIHGFIIIVYTLILLNILIFKYLDNPLQLITWNHPDYRGINLILFKNIWDANCSVGYNKNSIIGNILLFVPLPILYNIVIKDNWKKSLLLSFEISVIVELTQYIFRIGALDINDVFLNTLGGFLGIIIYKFAKKVFPEKYVVKIIGILGGLAGILVVALDTLIYIYN
ncbi:VanZ family protein [Clostridium senegalense]|uniref:VanZ family protein n=1 Tax=Clostridium senegalense TaxID=1465809 RepID=UPI001C11F0FB|nr:VanZ family protein [Clostridium senegalense]MBU5227959.1 VanZ family protein [Clostridium senegalense]